MPLALEPCDLTDGPTIAAVHTSAITPFMRYQFGTASISDIRDDLADKYSQTLADIHAGQSESVYLKVSDRQAGLDNMIAWADWIMPKYQSRSVSSGGLRGQPPRGINFAFLQLACPAIEKMRNRVLKGRECYVLNQLTTLPAHQRRGAGTMLLTWAFERADAEGVVCYLDTQMGGAVVRLYEKVGFVKVDQCVVNMSTCGLEGVYTHVAMVREPATPLVRAVHGDEPPAASSEGGLRS